MRSPSDTSFGSGFNSVGGGVYASKWSRVTMIWLGADGILGMQCIGRTVSGLKYGSSRGDQYLQISQPVHHNRRTGPHRWHSGLTQVLVIFLLCSWTIVRYSTLHFGESLSSFRVRRGGADEWGAAAIGQRGSGVALVCPDNQSAVNSKLDLRHAQSSYRQAEHHLAKLVSDLVQILLHRSIVI
jgi:hypothetical protein